MATKELEIEIKFSLGNDMIKQVAKNLQELAEFVGEYRQVDRYFNAPHRDFLKPPHPYEYLRLRETEGRNILTYKHVYFKKNGDFSHADEYETPVEQARHFLKILKVLNFKEFITIDKRRKKFEYKDELEIVLDRVKDLGDFLEIETIKEFKDIKEAQRQILGFADKLGIDAKQRNNDGYVLAMMKRKGLR